MNEESIDVEEMFEEEKVESKILVYIGPTIPGIAKESTVYNNGLPDALQKKLELTPILKGLIVNLEHVAKKRAELSQEGSALNLLYKKIMKE